MPFVQRLQLIGLILYELSLSILTLPVLVFPQLHTLLEVCGFRPAESVIRYKSLQTHQLEVAGVRKSVSQAHARGQKIVLRRKPGSGHSGRSASYKAGHHGVDVASLNCIIAIDADARVAHVQSGTTFESLCRATLRYGLLPLVVPEFRSITVGGAIQGIGIESTSWNNGAVDESVIDALLVLGDGSVVSSVDVPDLWKDIPGSNGSLALIVSARLRLAPAAPTINISYRLFRDIDTFVQYVDGLQQQSDFSWKGSAVAVDAVAIKAVGIVAMLAGCQEENPNRKVEMYQETAFSPFFFQHVDMIAKSKLAGDTIYEERQPTMQYLFRYDRGGFWGIMSLAQLLTPLKFILERPLLTGLLNHFLSTSTLYKIAMLISDKDRESVGMLQDVDVPKSAARTIVDWAISKDFQYLWLCPVKNGSKSIFSVSGSQEWVLNIGLYGATTGLPMANLELQRLVAKCQGKTALYAHVYAKEAEFWTWYDHGRYEQLRRRYHAQAFLGLWEKVGGISATIVE